MEPWLRIVIAVLIVTTLISLFIVGYLLNKKTPVPEGCEDILENCTGCQITSCTLHKPTEDKVEVI